MSQVTMRLLGLAKAHVESTGGTVDRMTCKFDEKRGGRVVNLVVFWPGDLGYSDARVTASDTNPQPIEMVRQLMRANYPDGSDA